MPEAANHTPPVSQAPAAAPALPSPQAPPASGAPNPVWLTFYILSCSVIAALLGRLAPFAFSASPNISHSPSSPGPDGLDDHPCAIIFKLIALDWFRCSRHAPASPEQLLRRSRVAQAVLSQSPAPVLACDLPGQAPAAGVFAPAFAGQLAAASAAPSFASTSLMNAFYATLSTSARPALSARNQAIFNSDASPDAASPAIDSTPFTAHSAFRIMHPAFEYSAFRIHHSALPRAPTWRSPPHRRNPSPFSHQPDAHGWL